MKNKGKELKLNLDRCSKTFAFKKRRPRFFLSAIAPYLSHVEKTKNIILINNFIAMSLNENLFFLQTIQWYSYKRQT